MQKRILKRRDRDSLLIFYYTRVLEKKPESCIFLPLADIYRRKGMPELAIQTCLKGLRLHPDYMSARVLLGISYFDCEKFDDAERELKMVVDSVADNIIARKVLSDIYRRKGMIDDALREMEAIVHIAPINKDFKVILENLQKARLKSYSSQQREVLQVTTAATQQSHDRLSQVSQSIPYAKSTTDDHEKKFRDTDDMENILDDKEAFEEIEKLFSSKIRGS
jgi:tetratricopeptide (TPR) repeat protein